MQSTKSLLPTAPPDPGRRRFLKEACATGMVALGSGLLVPEATASSFDFYSGVRTLKLYRKASKEYLEIQYLKDGVWLPDAYAKICWMLRDVQANKYVRMDVQLIAILDWTQRYLAQYGYTDPLSILSGFRTFTTNNHTEGAAYNSQHLYGKAVDFKIPGLPASYLGKLMDWLTAGGVGVYVKDGFVHVDTGRFRRWQGHPPK